MPKINWLSFALGAVTVWIIIPLVTQVWAKVREKA